MVTPLLVKVSDIISAHSDRHLLANTLCEMSPKGTPTHQTKPAPGAVA